MISSEANLKNFSSLIPGVDSRLIVERYLTKLPKGSRILEIGVGNGEICNLLAAYSFEVTGLDYSPHCLEKLSTKVTKILANIERDRIDLPQRHCDVILILSVLEHLSDPIKILEKLKPLLSPKGLLIASTPNINWFPFRFKFLFGKCPEDFHTTNHVQFWNLKYFRKMIETSGFTVEKHFTSFAFPNPLFPFVKKWRHGYVEIVNRYLFWATEWKSTILGYNQVIIASL